MATLFSQLLRMTHVGHSLLFLYSHILKGSVHLQIHPEFNRFSPSQPFLLLLLLLWSKPLSCVALAIPTDPFFFWSALSSEAGLSLLKRKSDHMAPHLHLPVVSTSLGGVKLKTLPLRLWKKQRQIQALPALSPSLSFSLLL